MHSVQKFLLPAYRPTRWRQHPFSVPAATLSSNERGVYVEFPGPMSGPLENRRTYAELASELGCSEKAVRQAVRRHGLGELARRRRRFPELYDDNWLRAVSATQARAEIAAGLGCSVEAVKAAQRRVTSERLTAAVPVSSGEQPERHVPRR